MKRFIAILISMALILPIVPAVTVLAAVYADKAGFYKVLPDEAGRQVIELTSRYGGNEFLKDYAVADEIQNVKFYVSEGEIVTGATMPTATE